VPMRLRGQHNNLSGRQQQRRPSGLKFTVLVDLICSRCPAATTTINLSISRRRRTLYGVQGRWSSAYDGGYRWCTLMFVHSLLGVGVEC
jgi:hypothetical protein